MYNVDSYWCFSNILSLFLPLAGKYRNTWYRDCSFNTQSECWTAEGTAETKKKMRPGHHLTDPTIRNWIVTMRCRVDPFICWIIFSHSNHFSSALLENGTKASGIMLLSQVYHFKSNYSTPGRSFKKVFCLFVCCFFLVVVDIPAWCVSSRLEIVSSSPIREV